MMPADEVLRVLDLLAADGLWAWVDGGWGVDALIGRQSREHQDLDLAILLPQASDVLRALRRAGYAVHEDAMPTRLELRDRMNHRVDLHPLTLDATGDGLQALPDGTFGRYTAEGLRGTGQIDGRAVCCLSASLQLRFHRGYPPRAVDRHDIALLERLSASPSRQGGRGAHAREDPRLPTDRRTGRDGAPP